MRATHLKVDQARVVPGRRFMKYDQLSPLNFVRLLCEFATLNSMPGWQAISMAGGKTNS